MPRIIITERALADIERLRRFLLESDHDAAQRAARRLIEVIQALEQAPHMGRPAPFSGDNFREVLVRFGQSGYVVAYRVKEVQNDVVVYVLALRHQREAGYGML